MNRPYILSIRAMCESDLDVVMVIELLSFSSPWHREHFQQEIIAPHSFPFVAELDGITDGYVCLMSLFEEAQILDIAVAPVSGVGESRVFCWSMPFQLRGKKAPNFSLLRYGHLTLPPSPFMNGVVLSGQVCVKSIMK